MNILCLGSLNIDHVYTMDHFVAAGETTAALDMQTFCGGKGLNQSIALARAGCSAFHAGMIGAEGAMLVDLLRENGVDTSLIRTAKGPTGHAVIQVDASGQNCIIIYGGANVMLDETYIDEVYARFAPGDIVLLQNEISNLRYALRRAGELGLRVALNPSPLTAELAAYPELAQVSWFILNEIEGRGLTGETDPQAICTSLRHRFPGCRVLLTLGEEGCLYVDDAQTLRQPIFRVPVVDTTAAGDTFTGYFLAGVREGLPMARVLRLAAKAASITVSAKGAAASIPLRAQVGE